MEQAHARHPGKMRMKGDEKGVRFTEESQHKEGDLVQYKSSSTGSWISAKVLKVKGHLLDLDCKPDVPVDRVRLPEELKEAPPEYKAGDRVEYFSSSQGKWVPAKVLQLKSNGRLDLDCKVDVSPESVRFRKGFGVGDWVEYYSSSQANWIAAQVGVSEN